MINLPASIIGGITILIHIGISKQFFDLAMLYISIDICSRIFPLIPSKQHGHIDTWFISNNELCFINCVNNESVLIEDVIDRLSKFFLIIFTFSLHISLLSFCLI